MSLVKQWVGSPVGAEQSLRAPHPGPYPKGLLPASVRDQPLTLPDCPTHAIWGALELK